MYDVVEKMDNMYQDAKKYGVGLGLAAVITLANTGIVGAKPQPTPKFSPEVEASMASLQSSFQTQKKGGIEGILESVCNLAKGAVDLAVGAVYHGGKAVIDTTVGAVGGTVGFLGKWIDNGVNNYESLDYYVYGNIGDKSRLNEILYGVGHLVPHSVADVGRSFHAIFAVVPDMAMENAKAQKAKQYGLNGPSFIEVKGPIEALIRAGQGMYILGEDTTRVIANYAGITGKGFLVEVTKRPLDTVGKAYVVVQITDLASDGPLDWERGGKGKGGGSSGPVKGDAPPAPPLGAIPPPAPF